MELFQGPGLIRCWKNPEVGVDTLSGMITCQVDRNGQASGVMSGQRVEVDKVSRWTSCQRFGDDKSL